MTEFRSALFFVIWFISAHQYICVEKFTEEVYLRPISKVKTLAHFEFNVRWAQTSDEFQLDHFNLFPKSLGQLIEIHDINELQVSFSKGKWKYDSNFGNLIQPMASGAQVLAWIDGSKEISNEYADSDEAHSNWNRLAASLSGIFCASIDSLQSDEMISPNFVFVQKKKDNQNRNSQNYTLNYGVLPHETSCTENLTPWLKLLPCRSKQGLAKLIIPTVVYDSAYHSMVSRVRRVCLNSNNKVNNNPQFKIWTKNCKVKGLELIQTLTYVIRKHTPPPWSLYSLMHRVDFESQLPFQEYTGCSLSDQTKIYLEHNHLRAAVTQPKAQKFISLLSGNKREDASNCDVIAPFNVAIFDYVPNLTVTSLSDSKNDYKFPQLLPFFRLHRYLTGKGLIRGGITAILSSTGSTDDQPVEVDYLEILPSFIRAYFHTLQVKFNGIALSKEELFLRCRYTPSIDYLRAGMFELQLLIPPGSTVVISYEFDRLFLPIEAFPPDPNRGYEIPASILSYTIPELNLKSHCNTTRIESPLLDHFPLPGTTYRLYSEELLLALPLPDFSMPYNVITLSCTIIAFFFGTILNLTVRRRPLVEEVVTEPTKVQQVIRLFEQKLWNRNVNND